MRVTPLDKRKPAMVFFDDPKAIDELASAKKRQIFREELKGEEVEPPESKQSYFRDRDDLSMYSLKKEFI